MPWLADLADLVLARACRICQAPGPSLCPSCLAALRQRPMPACVPLGHEATAVVPLHYRLDYSGVGQRLILDYKEHGDRSLCRSLGVLLADAIQDAIASAGAPACTLVPVPGHARPRRGFAALDDLLRSARAELRARGITTRLAPAVIRRRDHAPLKGLGRVQRWRTVQRALVADAHALRDWPPGPVIVVDDVVTTGATVLEAVRALDQGGVRVDAIAALCHQAADSGRHRRDQG